MTRKRQTIAITTHAGHVINDVYLPRIITCLNKLSRAQVWWRPNDASNSVGNLVLHLEGNVRQWIIAGLGGQPDQRRREVEFSTRHPLERRALANRLQATVAEACSVLRKLTEGDLVRTHAIQNFKATGFEAAFHVAEHFSHHAGQIILLAKMLKGRDLKFTQLPEGKKRKTGKLPAW